MKIIDNYTNGKITVGDIKIGEVFKNGANYYMRVDGYVLSEKGSGGVVQIATGKYFHVMLNLVVTPVHAEMVVR